MLQYSRVAIAAEKKVNRLQMHCRDMNDSDKINAFLHRELVIAVRLHNF